ncbi:MAG: hypothetical protein A2498_02055 [Lentisphaerae bacterium RIFOXYC12_FULL_60_16]|nr:MAG: hypothetical protein A2498_02055 [Lentisphaerae bacterium RIFOXYC12_FULL_60_16]
MKFMSVREFRGRTGTVRRGNGQDDEVVLTANGRPFAIVSRINPEWFDRELDAIRRARAGVALDRIRASAEKAGTSGITASAADTIIRNVRQSRETL